MSHCRKILSRIWFSAFAVVAIALAIQTMLGKYEPQPGEAWTWFTQTMLPSLLLIGGGIAYASLKHYDEDTVDRTPYRITVWLSCLYLAAVIAVAILQPIWSYTPLALMRLSRLWLGIGQSIVACMLGAFFVSQRDTPAAA